MKLSFSTLACPTWTWEQIIDMAANTGYDGIEIRGIADEMFLPAVPQFHKQTIQRSLEQLASRNLLISSLDTSCSFHDAAGFDASVAEGKATIELAAELGCPFIRVFGDKVPDESRKDEVIERIVQGIQALARHCEGSGVSVLLETHGDFASPDNLMPVLTHVNSPHFGLVWDIGNTYLHYRDRNADFFHQTKHLIRHVHVKDFRLVNDTMQYCITGQGEAPIQEDVHLLKEGGYTGHLSLEWEKRWHPELQEPEMVVPQFVQFMRQWIS